MKKYEAITFYKLREAIGYWHGNGASYFDSDLAMTITLGDIFVGIIEELTGADATEPNNTIYSSIPFLTYDGVESIWKINDDVRQALNLVSTRYSDNWAAWGEDEADAMKAGFDRLFAQILSTWERYSVILAAYEANKANMMAAISSSSTTIAKVKDTPQEAIDPLDNGYNSAVSTSEATASQDGGTKAQRLKELYESYRNILRDWSDEIASVFLDYNNI